MASWHARLRPEYRWPYPMLEVDVWYRVRANPLTLEPGRTIWLELEPYPVEVYVEHVEPLRIEPDRGVSPETDVEFRLARLRPPAARLYPGVPPGVWLNAREVAEHSVPHGSADPGGSQRRVRRLTDLDFDFCSRSPSHA